LATLLRYLLYAINVVTSWQPPKAPKTNPPTHMCAKKRQNNEIRRSRRMRWLPSLLCECDDFLTSATLMCFRFLFYAQLLSASRSFFFLRILCALVSLYFLNVCRWWNVAKDNCLTISRRVESSSAPLRQDIPPLSPHRMYVHPQFPFYVILILCYCYDTMKIKLNWHWCPCFLLPSLGSW